MRKLLTLLIAFAMMVSTSNAAFTETKTETKKSHSAFSSEQQKAAAEFFVKLSRKDYEELTGKHLGLAERLAFKLAQKQLKRELKREDQTEGFNIGGFLLGFLVGLIGVLLAYVFSKDSNLKKWAWIGFGIYVVILVIVLVAVAASN